ncbi:fibronectin type III domain-containing protein [Halorubrum halodurans]|uniref:fibronectin type III domain-containing protein n=1 Tax=Halorubrum halodurans TaxID=1383851 RepID=UPI001FE51CA5|nr:fibronectin type III domain-containing protein [Halorubrum halodurans]
MVTTIADLSTTSWTDTAVADGRQYQYTVRRVTPEATADSGQQSATTILPAPTGLAVDSVDDTGGTVSWTSNTTDATGHRIEVREDNTGSWTVAETGIAGNVESASVTGLRNGQLYGLRVVALAPDAESIDYEPDIAAGETLAIASGETYQFEKPHVNSGTVDNAGTMQPDDTQ